MPTNNLWAGVLSQLLIHQESGCPHSARHAIRLLCERASQRIGQTLAAGRHIEKECRHARPA